MLRIGFRFGLGFIEETGTTKKYIQLISKSIYLYIDMTGS